MNVESEAVYVVPAWVVIAWAVATVVIATLAYWLGAWNGWKVRPVNYYTIARCELSSKNNHTKLPGCPVGRDDIPMTPVLTEAQKRALDHARRNDECAEQLEASNDVRAVGSVSRTGRTDI